LLIKDVLEKSFAQQNTVSLGDPLSAEALSTLN
jgi:hypothetical protein